jgi:hypothetical protein
MNGLTQKAKNRQAIAGCVNKDGKSYAAQKCGVNLSSVKR